MRALQTCPTPGCPELTPGGCCEACAAKARGGYRKATRDRGHGSYRWRRHSIRFRRDHPYCEDEAHADTPELLRPRSQCVDHLDGLGPNGPRGYDDSNLEALCWSCHSRRTGRDYGGLHQGSAYGG